MGICTLITQRDATISGCIAAYEHNVLELSFILSYINCMLKLITIQ